MGYCQHEKLVIEGTGKARLRTAEPRTLWWGGKVTCLSGNGSPARVKAPAQVTLLQKIRICSVSRQLTAAGLCLRKHGCLLAHRGMFDLGVSEVHCLLSAWKKVLVSIQRVVRKLCVTIQVAHPQSQPCLQAPQSDVVYLVLQTGH